MKIYELLKEIGERAIQLRKSGDELTIFGNPETLTQSLLGELRAHKATLLGLIPDHSDKWWTLPVSITPEMLPLVHLTVEEIGRIVGEVPGGAANVQDIYPLAPLQEGILFHHLMGGEADPYLLAGSLSFDSRARLEEYVNALQAVVDRHDILRTGMHWEGLAEPVQVVWRKAELPVEEVTLRPEAGPAAEQLRARYHSRQPRIDVRQAPLLRIYIAPDPVRERWQMLLLLHHLAGDHTTLEVMQKEIQAHLLGQAGQLAEPLPFRNLMAQIGAGVSRQEHEAFFGQLLGDVDEPTAPFGMLNVRGDGTDIGEARLGIDESLARRMRECARKLGVSPASVCHVGWAQVLARVTGREDVVFGTVLLGRMQGGAGSGRGMGLFINTLPVRIRMGEAGAEECVRGTHRLLAELLGHEHASLALAQRCSGVPAPLPLFTSLLNYRHSRGEEEAEAKQGWEGIEVEYGEERTNYPIGLSVDDLGEGFELTAQVQASVEPGRVCELMATALGSLVEALEKEPGKAVGTLEVLPAAERRRVLYEWNATEREYPRDRCVHELFEEQARQRPEAAAVVYEGRECGYGELNRRANRLGHYLREIGVGPDARVAICMERSLEMIVAVLAVLKAGGAYVPLDLSFPAERIRFMVADSGASIVVARQGVELPEMPAVVRIDVDRTHLAEGLAENPDVPTESQASACIMYTSGSTGQPKGVMVPHRAIGKLVLNNGYAEFSPNDRVAFAANPAFDAATMEIWAPLLNGGCIVVIEQAALLEPKRFAEVLKQQTVGVLWLTAGLFHQYAAELSDELAGLRYLIVGGDVLDPKMIARVLRNRPEHLVNGYGPTETTTFAATHEITTVSAAAGTSIPIGRPIGNTRIYILDGRRQPVPVGVAGELYIGGEGVARGYLNRPELTAERFLPDPYSPDKDGRMYKSGDLGRWLADGSIEFLGRNDLQVKIRGFRIELGEIEARLAEYVGVREAVVVAREDTAGDKRLVAYYTAREGEEIGVEQLRAHLSSKLPEYMVPAAYVRLETMPLTGNGKLDRKALPAPEGDAYAVRGYEAPEGEIETALAEIWAQVLKQERVGRHDNFFELGGHSLLAVTLIERMRRSGYPVDVRALFATPTLAELAAGAGAPTSTVEAPENRIPEECEAITPEMLPLVKLSAGEIEGIVRQVPGGAANIQDIYPLAPLQEGILFHHLMGGEGDPYLLAGQLGFDSRARLEVYVDALRAVIARHDILRTAVVWEGLPEPVQVVCRKAQLAVEEVDVDPAAGDVADQLYERYSPRKHRIDLRQAPLLRIYIAADAGRKRWVMMQMLHHMVGDHSAMDVMNEEIQAYLLGQAEQLPAPLPFRNLVAQVRLGVSQEEHEAFFRGLLGDVEEATAPFGLMKVRGDGTGIEEATLGLEPGLVQRVRERARKLKVSVATLCHLAWACVVARTSGRQEAVFGTVLFGRMRAGAGSDRVMGLFINTLPLRILVGEEGVEEAVAKTQRVLADLVRHEHASLALAQRCSSVAAPGPLFTSLLNYRHMNQVQMRRAEESGAWDGIERLRGEERTNYPFTLSVNDGGEDVSVTAQTESSVEPRRVCELMATALGSLVEALEKEPGKAVGTLEVLPAAERRRVLYEWNATEREYPRDRCVHELFEEQARQRPEAAAVVYEGRECGYGELNRRANRLGHYLRENGVGPDARVAICMERSLEMIVAILAVLKAGGAYVPLDPAYPTERLSYMLQDSEPQVVLTQTHLKRLFAEVGGTLPLVDLSAETAPWKEQPETDLERAGSGLSPSNLAYVMYTSGSTGVPKGIMVTHRNVIRLVKNTNYVDYSPALTIAHVSNVAFDASTFEIWGSLLNGCRLAIIPKFDVLAPKDFVRQLKRVKASTLFLTTALFNECVRSYPGAFQGMDQILFGGENCDGESVRRALAEQPPRDLVHVYGPTETTTFASYFSIQTAAAGTSIPIGRPIGNTRIYILDGRRQPVPVGVAGELYIGGEGVARGYLNRPELTAERFLPDPYSPEKDGRMYKSGDLGRWLADGTIEFLGRNDLQVKMRGFRIELGEIEARLAEYVGVREAVVVAREDTAGDKRLVAYYTAREGEEIGVEQLRAHLSSKLPEYMVPAAYVRLETMPLTGNGKLDRQALPAPEGDAYAVRGYEAPEGEIETALAEIWAQVLKQERVGRRDNFFELGGHSLLAVTLIERMRRSGYPVDVRALFATPTLAELAAGAGAPTSTVEAPENRIPEECEAITPEMLPLVKLSAGEIEGIVRQVPGGAANIQDIYPLAPLQEGILFHHLMGGEGDPYLLAGQLGFDSRARLEAYVDALRAVIARHDILRTAIVWEGLPEPVQVVCRKAQLAVEEVDVDPAAGDVADQLYERYSPRKHRIDLRQAPLLRIYIAADAGRKRWVMMQMLHHMVGDHSAMDVMNEEIQAYLLGQAELLPAPLPFRNLVAQVRLGVSQEEHEAFFRGLLGDVEEATAPFGLIKVRGDGTGIEEATLGLEPGLVQRVRERARKLKVSVATLCHLAWACVVARTSGRQEAVFGTVLFGRMRAGAGSDRVMGLFINTLPLRIGVGEEGVEEAVAKTQRVLADLVRHEHASLALAQRCSSVAAPGPLFTSLLNYRHMNQVQMRRAEESGAWDGIERLRGEERTNYPFTLSVNDGGEDVSVTAQTESSVEPRRVCELMATALGSLVEALEKEPGKAVGTLEVLPAAERQRVLYEWNATEREYPRDRCVHELFEEQARQRPEAAAVVYEGGECGYGELNRRANRLGHYLREIGVGPDARVAICMERSLEMIVAILAVLKAGGAYVPLDLSFPAERIRFMVADSGAGIVVARQGVELPEMPAVVRIDVDRTNLAEDLAENLDVPTESQASACIMYTSGSTGRPKGVMVPHRAIGKLVLNNGYAEFSPNDRVAFAANPAFDAATMEIWAPLLNGGCIVVIEQAALLEPKRFAEVLKQQTVGVLWLTAGLFHQYAAELSDELAGLRYLIVGGDVLDPKMIARVLRNRPEHLVNGYGPTETTTFAATHEITSVSVAAGTSIPIGRPIGNTRIYILDGRRQPVPVGVAGELYIGGEGVARGYLNRPELTAERFLPDPYSPDKEGRMYKSGDLGRWLADGTIEFLGRNDLQVKMRGFRIELGEIEARLAEYVGVREAVVVAREDTAGDKRLVAYYTAREGEAIGVEQLRAHLSSKLPEYMVPAAYVRQETMPLTGNGKLDRQALPAPEGDAYAVRGYEAPEGEIETALAEIWAQVLKQERVGRHDNFFELGGHSLLAVRVVMQVSQRLQLDVAVSDLFSQPQLKSFAALVVSPQCQHSDRAVPIREQGTERPLFLAHEGADEIVYAWALAPYVDSRIPIYALPARQSGGRLRTIQGMARRMVKMIREVQPVGPYRVGGYSFGGILAYEIAAQLVGMDQEVELVALFDLQMSGTTDDLPLVTSATANQDLESEFLSVIYGYAVSSGMNESIQQAVIQLRQSSNTLEELIQHCRERNWLIDTWKQATAAQIRRILTHVIDLRVAPYHYSLLPADICLFIAQEEKLASDLTSNYSRLIPGIRLNSIHVPGNHRTMVQEPNIRQLGHLLSQVIRDISKKSSASAPADSLVSLTPLKQSAEHNVAPLFCLPGLSVPGPVSGASYFADLISSLKTSRPIYEFRPHGLVGNTVPWAAIEPAAKFYSQELERVYPAGPVHLMGHLLGGWTAFEMGLALSAGGREVLSMIILDCEPPIDKGQPAFREYSLNEVIVSLLASIELSTGRSVIGLADLGAESPHRQREILKRLSIECGFMPTGATDADLAGLLRLVGTGLRIEYTPRSVYPGLVRLVAAETECSGRNRMAGNEAATGWRRWASSVVESRSPGNCMTMLKPPHAHVLAAMIVQEMNQGDQARCMLPSRDRAGSQNRNRSLRNVHQEKLPTFGYNSIGGQHSGQWYQEG